MYCIDKKFSKKKKKKVMSECVSSGVLEPKLPSLARLLALLGIFDGKSQNLTGADSYASVAIA